MKTAWWTLIVAVVLAGSGTRARAEQPARETRFRHYGWQVLAVDAAAIGVGFFTVPDDAWLYLIGYGFGPPAVHLGHRNVGRATISFFGRAFMMAMVMGHAGGGSGDQGDTRPAIAAAIAFMLADAAFAWDRCPVPRPAPALRPVAMPVARSGWTLGLAGQF